MGAFISAIPGAVGLGLIWGIMAIGVTSLLECLILPT